MNVGLNLDNCEKAFDELLHQRTANAQRKSGKCHNF